VFGRIIASRLVFVFDLLNFPKNNIVKHHFISKKIQINLHIKLFCNFSRLNSFLNCRQELLLSDEQAEEVPILIAKTEKVQETATKQQEPGEEYIPSSIAESKETSKIESPPPSIVEIK
jgi:hypothetical protein